MNAPIPSIRAEQTATGVRLFYGFTFGADTEPVWRFRDLGSLRGADDDHIAQAASNACRDMWPGQIVDDSAAVDALFEAAAAQQQREGPIQTGRLVALQMQLLVTEVYERFTVFGMAFVGGLASFIAAKGSSEPALSSLIAIPMLLISLVCGLGSLLLGYFTAQSRIGLANRELISTRLAGETVHRQQLALRAMFAAQWRHLCWLDRGYLRPLMRGVFKHRPPNDRERAAGTGRLANAARNQSFLARVHLVLGVFAAIVYVIGSTLGW